MIAIREANERGYANHGWLETRHTFSFADYHDPNHVSFSSLRVINEDRVAPGAGFPRHPHRDMEILTYVLEGALRHEDSMGNGSVIEPGDLQRMSAGTGVVHSEYNASSTDLVHFLQIWILPKELGIPPGYEQRRLAMDDSNGSLRLAASPDGRDGSVTIRQDARLYIARLEPGHTTQHKLASGRKAYLQVARGQVRLGERELHPGDGAQIYDEPLIRIAGTTASEVLLFDLP